MFLAAASPGPAAPSAPEADDFPKSCGSIEDCIGLLTGAISDGRSVAAALIGQRLEEYGPAGADALVPLLAHPSDEISRRAAWALGQFEGEFDPRHLPALIAAHKRGLRVAEMIARTGSDEALRYLQSVSVPGGDDNGALWALPLLGRRAEPFLLRELERCRKGCSRLAADALLNTLGKIGPMPDQAKAVVRDVAASGSADPVLRREMEDQLIDRAEPEALPIIVRRLAALRGVEHEEWLAADLLEQVRRHGEGAGASAGPLVLYYMSRPEMRRSRNAAVVTSWVINYRPAVPALRRLLAEADRDWLLAYDTVWALAELGGLEARPEIARLARRHWYRPVRNNARRALNKLGGGEFELPELPGEMRGAYAGELNFAVDVDSVQDCRFERASETLRFGRNAPVPVRRPRRGAVRVEIEAPPQQGVAPLGKAPGRPPYGTVTLDWRRAGGRVVGVDGKRWDGGLFVAEANGALRPILPHSVLAAFEMSDGLLILTGDSTRPSGEGDAWRLRKQGSLDVVDGPLRLPAAAKGFALASDGTLLVRTYRGDVAIGRSGRLMRPRPCPDKASGQ